MSGFAQILRRNRNYRACWLGQTVSEVGDHFNSIAVLSLALHLTGSGAAVGAVMIARVLPAIVAGPVAGVVLDRMDRRKVMIASDVLRAVVALAHILLLTYRETWLLYALSGLLMFASPFFNSGRSAILPRIASQDELHTANALTQTTSWLTLSIGTMLGGLSTAQFGYKWAFVANAASFAFSAAAIWSMRGDFRPERGGAARRRGASLEEFRGGLRYMAARPLILGIALLGVGWSTGGGAAQVLFTLFGEVVFARGPAGIGLIWSSAGIGLVLGGVLGHRLGRGMGFERYKRTVTVAFFLHGLCYVVFSVMGSIYAAMVFIALSRVAMGLNSVLNRGMLLAHVPDGLRGRVFTTVETMSNAVMLLSMGAAGAASTLFSVREIGVVAGVLSASTAVFWGWANRAGKLPEPERETREPEREISGTVTPA
ncbi:MAG: MFS transporter [Candidatus Solibacter usitatus]|nr:MFS transporter [Candidatus Solibacter usitatus]